MKNFRYPILVFSLLLFFIYNIPFHLYEYHSDFWSHAAVLRELASYPLSSLQFRLLNLHHQMGPIPYIYNPYTFTLACVQKLTGASAVAILKFSSLVNFTLFAWGLHLFLKKYFSDPRLSLWMLPLLLFFWGKSWDFSGAYDIGGMAVNLTSPYFFAFALAFFVLFLFVRFLREVKWGSGILLSLLTAAMALINFLPAFFAVGGMILIAIFEKKKNLKPLGILAGFFLLAGILATAWPFFSILRLVKDGFSMTAYFDPSYYFHWGHLSRLGPLLLGLPLLLVFIRQKRYPFVTGGFAFFLVCYFTAFLLKNPLGWRIVFFITFFLHLAVGLYLKDKSLNGKWAVTLAAVFFLSVLYQTASLTAKQFGFHSFGEVLEILQNNPARGMGFERRFRHLSEQIPSKAVVFTDLETAYVLPAFRGRPIASREGIGFYDTLIPGLKEHEKDIKDFFSTGTSTGRRMEILSKYRPEFLIWNEDKSKHPPFEEFKQWGQVIYRKDGFSLISLAQD